MLSFIAIDRTLNHLYNAHSQACAIDATKHDIWLGLIDSVSLTTADSVRSLNPNYGGYEA